MRTKTPLTTGHTFALSLHSRISRRNVLLPPNGRGCPDGVGFQVHLSTALHFFKPRFLQRRGTGNRGSLACNARSLARPACRAASQSTQRRSRQFRTRPAMLGGRTSRQGPTSTTPGTPAIGLRERGNDTSGSTGRSGRTQHAKGRTGDRPGPRKEAATRRNVIRGGGRGTAYGACASWQRPHAGLCTCVRRFGRMLFHCPSSPAERSFASGGVCAAGVGGMRAKSVLCP